MGLGISYGRAWFDYYDMNCCWDYFNVCVSFRRICLACIMKSDSVQSEDLYSVWHYCDVIMGAVASQITNLMIVYSTVYSDADQRKHQSAASLAFVRGIHLGPVNSPHEWPVTRKMFPIDDVIVIWMYLLYGTSLVVLKLKYQLYATYLLFFKPAWFPESSSSPFLTIWWYFVCINVLVAINSFWKWIWNPALKWSLMRKAFRSKNVTLDIFYNTKITVMTFFYQVGKLQLRFCCGLVSANLTLMGNISFSGPWFNIKISYQYKKSYCGDDTVISSSYPRMIFSNLVRWQHYIESAP